MWNFFKIRYLSGGRITKIGMYWGLYLGAPFFMEMNVYGKL